VGQPQLVAQARPDFGLEHSQVAQLQLVALENLQLPHCPLSQAILCVVHMLTYNVIYINIKIWKNKQNMQDSPFLSAETAASSLLLHLQHARER
jgi:hypothetical protein